MRQFNHAILTVVLKRICSRITNLADNRYSLDSFLLKFNSSCSNSVSSSSDNLNYDKKANESQDNVKTSSKNDEDQSSSSSKQTDINDRSGSTSSSSDHSNIDEEANVSQGGVQTSNVHLRITLKSSTAVDNFNIMTSGNDKTEAMHNRTSTTDQIIKLSLFTLSLFLHATEECLVNQPISNYRQLVISNLKKKSFCSALATETTDITEEIYITIYEIKKNESPAFTTPKITSTYSTKEGSYDLSNLSGYHAIYPTQIGLIKLAKALKLHQDKLDYYGQISDID